MARLLLSIFARLTDEKVAANGEMVSNHFSKVSIRPGGMPVALDRHEDNLDLRLACLSKATGMPPGVAQVSGVNGKDVKRGLASVSLAINETQCSEPATKAADFMALFLASGRGVRAG